MVRWLPIALFALAGAPAASPAEPGAEPRVEVSDDGATLYFAGDIDLAGHVAVRKAVEAHPALRELAIASAGGEVMAARLMASVVNRRHLAVHVEYLCASACTQVLLAAGERSIGPAARVGFHQSYVVTPPPRSSSKISSRQSSRRTDDRDSGGIAGDAMMRRIMADAGVDADFIDHALTTPPDDMWFPDAAELLAAHVVTRVAPTPRTAGPSWRVERSDADRALTGPFWSVLHRDRPAEWDKAADVYWRERNSGRADIFAYLAARDVATMPVMAEAARASDALVSQLLDAVGERARQAELDGYRACGAAYPATPEDIARERAFGAREDAVLAEVMAAGPARAPMSAAKASDRLADGLYAGDEDDWWSVDVAAADGGCSDGMRVFARIASRPAQQRLRLFRALLTLF